MRRELAAAESEHEVHHFRKRAEPKLVEKITWELLADADRFTRPPAIAPRLAPASSRQPIPADLVRMTARPADLDTRPRAHEMGIHRRYFDLIASGRKTTEIRVNDSSRRKIKLGSLIRFRCQAPLGR